MGFMFGGVNVSLDALDRQRNFIMARPCHLMELFFHAAQMKFETSSRHMVAIMFV